MSLQTSWIVETQLNRQSPWQFYAKAPSRQLAGILASYPKAGGYRTRVRPWTTSLNISFSPPPIPKEQPVMKAAAANPVDRAFEFFMQLTPTEQTEFRAMLKGRDFPAPPAQMALTDKPTPRAPKQRKEKSSPGAAEQTNAASV